MADSGGDRYEEIRSGSEEAFVAFHRAQARLLFGYLFRLTRSSQAFGDPRARAEDLFQETWRRFAATVQTVPPRSDLRALLFTIGRNAFLDDLRRRQREGRVLLWEEVRDHGREGHEGAGSIHVAADSAEEQWARKQELARVMRAFEALQAPLQEALYLTAVAGLSSTEVAAMLQITPEALRKRVERARTELLRLLEARRP